MRYLDVELLVIGTSHRVASVDVRGRVAAAIDASRVSLAELGVTEHFVLSTCHRVELYAMTTDVEETQTAVVGGIAGEHVYVLAGLEAAVHLGRVASGLDSMVVGEAEIAGQIRRAVGASREAGTAGARLNRIAAGALRASGRARSETRISVGVMSAASAAVALVDQTLGGLRGRSVLVIGAGQAGRQVLARLAKLRAGARFVSSRSAHHAHDAAEKYGAAVVPLDELPAAAARVDAVIAAAQAPSLLLTAEHYRAATSGASAGTTGRPVLMVDLSAPRVLDPTLGDLDRVTLRTVDDLGDIVRQSTARRLGEIPRVEAIVEAEVRRSYAAIATRTARRQSQSS